MFGCCLERCMKGFRQDAGNGKRGCVHLQLVGILCNLNLMTLPTNGLHALWNLDYNNLEVKEEIL
jgi:hypothetical protein